MAVYFVASGGSNTAPYDTWAKAATSLQTALTAAASDGDIVVVQYNAVPSADAELSVDTTYTFASKCALLSASNDGGSSFTQTVMGSANWIGNSTANRSITFAGSFANYIAGLTLRLSGTGADNIRLNQSSGSSKYFEDCFFWIANTSASSPLQTGSSTVSQAYTHVRGCTVRFGNTSQGISCTTGKQVFEELTIDASGSAITQLLLFPVTTAGMIVGFYGCDLSATASTATLVPNVTLATPDIEFVRCKLPSSYVVMDAQTEFMAGAKVTLRDCATGDTHGNFEYHDAFGSMVLDRSTYFTAGAAGLSWKISTTSATSIVWPFRTPWIDLYNTGTSAITPYLEFLRNNGSAAAYKDNQVWAQFSVKSTSGSVISTLTGDREASFGGSGTAQAAGAGTGSWTIAASSSPYSFKCDSGSSVTPAEAGAIRARIVVAVPSIAGTLFCDPQIRS